MLHVSASRKISLSGVGTRGSVGASLPQKVLICQKLGQISKNLSKGASTFFNNINEIELLCH